MIPAHERRIQRWAHRLTLLAVVVLSCIVTAIWTLVYVGVNLPSEKPASGNITCWMDADGKSVKCFAPSGEFTCWKQ